MKKHSKWNRLWIAISITAVTLIVVIVYLYDTSRIELLWKLEWKSLWTSFKIWEKATLIIGAFAYPIFVSLVSSWLYNRIFPNDKKEIIKAVEKGNQQSERNQKELLKAIQENAIKQGVTKTEEELIQENKELKAKLQKEAVISIDTKLQAKLDKLFSEFRYEEFRNTIDDFINESDQKDLAKLHYQKALAYEAEINYSGAKQELETAVVLDKINPEILHQYAFILVTIGDYDKAIDYYEKALKINLKVFDGKNHLNNAPIYNNLGWTWHSKGEYDKAIDYYEKSLKINLKVFDGKNHPSIAPIYNNFGMAWESKGEHDKAIDFFEKSLKIDLKIFGDEHPDTATDYNNLGGAWHSKDEYKKAITYYEKALEILRNVHPKGHPYIDITERSLKFAKQAKNK